MALATIYVIASDQLFELYSFAGVSQELWFALLLAQICGKISCFLENVIDIQCNLATISHLLISSRIVI